MTRPAHRTALPSLDSAVHRDCGREGLPASRDGGRGLKYRASPETASLRVAERASALDSYDHSSRRGLGLERRWFFYRGLPGSLGLCSLSCSLCPLPLLLERLKPFSGGR